MNMPDEVANLQETGARPVLRLAERLGENWLHLQQAAKMAYDARERYRKQWEEFTGEDRSVVVFGSLARGELTEDSDTDWTLLVDGRVDPTHLEAALKIRENVKKAPGREGVFGSLAFSHDIVHCIGGGDDSNSNTTRRILLLLESVAIGNDQAWSNVRRNILHRYLSEDMGLWQDSNQRGVPLFLLNDISRYWRTMTVDFAYKQRTRNYDGYALKSLKLGFSRKLIYLSGVLACLRCEIEFPSKELFTEGNPQAAIHHLEKLFAMTPLEMFADSLLNERCYGMEQRSRVPEAARRAFEAYDAFIAMLADGNTREHLEKLDRNELESDKMYRDARLIRHKFSEATKDLFLRIESPMQQQIIERGVM